MPPLYVRGLRRNWKATSSPGRFSLALEAGREKAPYSRPAPKAREKRPGDEVDWKGQKLILCFDNPNLSVSNHWGHAQIITHNHI